MEGPSDVHESPPDRSWPALPAVAEEGQFGARDVPLQSTPDHVGESFPPVTIRGVIRHDY
jgi:hypothetical protein